MITKIQKRDGRQMPFNVQKIADAIYKAATAVGGKDYNSAIALVTALENKYKDTDGNFDLESFKSFEDDSFFVSLTFYICQTRAFNCSFGLK